MAMEQTYVEISAKTVSEAITEACRKFGVTSDRLDYKVLEEGSKGLLGFGSKLAVIKASVKPPVEDASSEELSAGKSVQEKPVSEKASSEKPVSEKISSEKPSSEKVSSEKPVSEKTSSEKSSSEKPSQKRRPSSLPLDEVAKNFLNGVFNAMHLEVEVDVKYDEEGRTMDIDLMGEEMGVLIGKRGQTLDSLQYLVSLVVNREVDDYIRVKVDTEDYRERRKETLENLAKNIAYKVKKTKRPLSLEPMNPYERRVIHSALQNDKYVSTHSEGDEPFRRVIVTYKRQ